MYLYDSDWTDITNQSLNGCWGDDCYDDAVCSTGQRETFTMSGLAAGDYVIVFQSYSHSYSGEYTVSVYCEDDINTEVTPGCNFVHFDYDADLSDTMIAVGTGHRYPIGGCHGVSGGNISDGAAYSYTFLCNSDDEVVLTHYFGTDECDGSAATDTSTENVDGTL